MTARRSLLIVDDDQEIRNLLGDVLGRDGYEIIYAENGKEAYDLVLEDYIDGVVLDIRMPHGSGEEFLHEIQSIPKQDRPAIFVISGYDDLSLEEIQQLGAVRFFKKPFRAQGLAKSIQDYFTKANLEVA